MLSVILYALFRHILTSAGGALFSYGLQTLSPTHIAAGGAMAGIGAVLSILDKVKTKSGPDYSGLNQ